MSPIGDDRISGMSLIRLSLISGAMPPSPPFEITVLYGIR
jgi:hypothetical protein